MTERHEQDPDDHPDLEDDILAAELAEYDDAQECFNCGKLKPFEDFSAGDNVCKNCMDEQDHQDQVRSDYNASRL